VLLISLTIVTLVYGVTYLMDIEDTNINIKEINIDKYVRDINTLIITENNNQICNSLTGVCTPPPGWYSTNN
jgi:PP-loop superfamily ATP-utilizing enzyme